MSAIPLIQRSRDNAAEIVHRLDAALETLAIVLPGDGPSIQVSLYGFPLSLPASDWYLAQGHSSKHSGLDINLNKAPWGDVELGQPIYATCNGLVVFAGQARGAYWGNLVITCSVDQGGLVFWRYAHARDVVVKAGQVVEIGTLVGHVGKGANDRYAAHLHLDCWRGHVLTPEAWLDRRGVWLDPLEVWAEAGYEWGFSKR